MFRTICQMRRFNKSCVRRRIWRTVGTPLIPQVLACHKTSTSLNGTWLPDINQHKPRQANQVRPMCCDGKSVPNGQAVIVVLICMQEWNVAYIWQVVATVGSQYNYLAFLCSYYKALKEAHLTKFRMTLYIYH